MSESSLYPMRVYLYDEKGLHDGGRTEIYDLEHLLSKMVHSLVFGHIRKGLEVRITDPMDFLVFHANHGQVLYPPQGGKA